MCDDKDDNDLLYGDLESAGKDADIAKLRAELDSERAKSSSQETEIITLKEQIICLVSDKEILERNLLAIYNTARNEIKRKDRELQELRTEKILHQQQEQQREQQRQREQQNQYPDQLYVQPP